MLQKQSVSKELLELLNELQREYLLKDYILGGGTALALQIGHRKSIDIDLFYNSLDASADFAVILDACRTIFKNVNIVSVYENRSLITHIDGIKVDFVVQRNSKMLDNPVLIQGLRLASLKDIAAMKIMAIATTSNRIKDYIDIYYLLKYFSLSDLFDMYLKKYNIDSIQTAIDNLPYFHDVSKDEFEALDFLGDAPSLKDVCSVLTQEVKKYSEIIMREML